MRRWHPSKHTGKLLKREVAAATSFAWALSAAACPQLYQTAAGSSTAFLWSIRKAKLGLTGGSTYGRIYLPHNDVSARHAVAASHPDDASEHPLGQRPGVPTV